MSIEDHRAFARLVEASERALTHAWNYPGRQRGVKHPIEAAELARDALVREPVEIRDASLFGVERVAFDAEHSPSPELGFDLLLDGDLLVPHIAVMLHGSLEDGSMVLVDAFEFT